MLEKLADRFAQKNRLVNYPIDLPRIVQVDRISNVGFSQSDSVDYANDNTFFAYAETGDVYRRAYPDSEWRLAYPVRPYTEIRNKDLVDHLERAAQKAIDDDTHVYANPITKLSCIREIRRNILINGSEEEACAINETHPIPSGYMIPNIERAESLARSYRAFETDVKRVVSTNQAALS